MIIDNIVNKDINGNAANVNEKSIYNYNFMYDFANFYSYCICK